MPQGTGSPFDNPIAEISPTELKARLDRNDDVVLVDVREEFERHIADLPECGQHRIPVGEFAARSSELDPDTTIVLYCRSGGRSGWAAHLLLAKGFEKVLNLRGGVLGWREEVDPTLNEY